MSATLSVVVAGAAGRLGRLAVEAITAAEDLSLAGMLVRGDDAAAVLKNTRPDVFLDVSLMPDSAALSTLAAERGSAPVVGTSGWSESGVAALAAACEAGGVGGLLVPNFSPGAVLQMQLAERLARHLACTGIHEVHHPAKQDSPSGTARATAARIARRQEAPPITSDANLR